jgi:hypothetical protein
MISSWFHKGDDCKNGMNKKKSSRQSTQSNGWGNLNARQCAFHPMIDFILLFKGTYTEMHKKYDSCVKTIVT